MGLKEKSLKISVFIVLPPQGIVTKSWNSFDTLVYAMLVDPQDHLLLGTDRRGKIYRVFPDGEYQQVVELKAARF